VVTKPTNQNNLLSRILSGTHRLQVEHSAAESSSKIVLNFLLVYSITAESGRLWANVVRTRVISTSSHWHPDKRDVLLYTTTLCHSYCTCAVSAMYDTH